MNFGNILLFAIQPFATVAELIATNENAANA